MPIATPSLDTSFTHSQDPIAIAASGPSDEELLKAVHRGDVEALGVLYDRHRRCAFAVALRILDDACAAEDAVHDAFLAVWRRSETFDAGRGTARGWLLAIVRHAAIDRRRSRGAHAHLDASVARRDHQLEASADETFSAVTAHLEAERIRAALDDLPSEQREAIELAYFGGLTHQEIAERTGTPLGTVKGRLRLGLHKLRASLADLLPPDRPAREVPAGQTPHDRSWRAVSLGPAQPVIATLALGASGPAAPVILWLAS